MSIGKAAVAEIERLAEGAEAPAADAPPEPGDAGDAGDGEESISGASVVTGEEPERFDGLDMLDGDVSQLLKMAAGTNRLQM